MFKKDWDDASTESWWPTRPVEGSFRLPSPWDVFMAETRKLVRAAFLRRTRRELMELTDDQLRDIGVTRERALTEARRSMHLD